jgi:hypothetical protein
MVCFRFFKNDELMFFKSIDPFLTDCISTLEFIHLYMGAILFLIYELRLLVGCDLPLPLRIRVMF